MKKYNNDECSMGDEQITTEKNYDEIKTNLMEQEDYDRILIEEIIAEIISIK